MKPTVRPFLVLAVGATLGALGLGTLWARSAPDPRPPDIVFVVLDTVRASTTSICGHGDPTTPTLERLVSEGFTHSCAAITPGTWTIPSHASFFTGRPVIELAALQTVPDTETLAGQLQARGYQTVMVSANMVLKKPDYLTAGFDFVRRASSFTELRGPALTTAVADALSPLDPDRPLFLFVNVIDAHSPYPAVPAGVPWLEAQRPVHHRMFDADPDSPFNLYVSGRMKEGRQQTYRSRLTRGYAWAVHEADATLAGLLSVLHDADRLDSARVVITSDHGEFVGEHGQVGHGDTLFDPGIRVPLLVRAAPGEATPVLQEPFPLRHVYDYLLGGQLPEVTAQPVTAVHHRPSPRTSYNGVSTWADEHTKLVWREGHGTVVYDLDADPGEQQPLEASAHPLTAELEALGRAHLEASEVAGSDPETTELLRAAGYVE